ncbi:MAG: DUF4097 domain-containing protein [Gemmatimonadales bacterium]
MQHNTVRLLHRLAALATVATMALSAAPSAQAQRSDDSRPWLERCRDGWGDRDRAVACREQELTMPVTGGELSVNARPNGSITVVGSNRRDIHVTARIQAQARSQSDADALMSEIAIVTDRGLRAEGPRAGRDEGWSVSYVIEVPREIDLTLSSTNGGVNVREVTGRLEMSTTNGGITLASVAGDVRGRTSNGSVNVTLEGDRWQGQGLDVQTTNGSVRLYVPERYHANLEAGTTNGGMNFDFPVTVRGRISRRMETQLGDGGALIRVMTTNGGVRVTRK